MTTQIVKDKTNAMETFKEISVGGFSKDQLISRLVAAGIQFNAYAKTLFENPAFAPDGPIERLRLVKVKPPELGLQNPYSLEKAIGEASRLGLTPCPLYLGAFLRLDYLDQPEGPYLTIASSRLESDENYPTGFYVRNFEKSLWLRGYRALGECNHPVNNELVFLK
ncbi:MAG: hypothetical protein ACXVB9_09460 [Bdellovibrionota bacterium]